jgi:hypothetical protein
LINPAAGRAQARKTTLSVGAVLIFVGALSLLRHHWLRAEIAGGGGIVLLLAALLAPRQALRFHRAWMKLAAALGYINSRIILSVMYYGVLTPLGFILRTAGRDPLHRRAAAQPSYWIPRPRTRQDRDQFERLF